MAKKKTFDIDQAVANILALGTDCNDIECQKLIRQAASQYKNKTMLELKTMIVEEQRSAFDLQRQIDGSPDLILRNDIQVQIDKFAVKEKIWDTAIALRKESYKRPAAPLSQLIADNGIYTVSPGKPAKRVHSKLSDTVGDESGEVVRNNGRATIYHPANKELTLQDAKVLIGVHKLWEENGRPKEFEVSIYELAKTIGRNTGGRSYIQIWNSLETISDTKIELQFESDSGKKTRIDRFAILQSIGARGSNARLMFSDVMFNSLQRGALIHLSLAILEDLETNTAQGLYPFLASQIAQGIDEWKVEDLIKLLGIKAKGFKQRKKMIEDACSHILECGLLKYFEFFEDEFDTCYLKVEPSETLLSTKRLFDQSQKNLLS